MKNTILNVPFVPGLTRTDRALRMANTHLFSDRGGARKNTGKLLLVMTDGVTNEGSEPYSTVLEPIKVHSQANILTDLLQDDMLIHYDEVRKYGASIKYLRKT